MAGDNAAPPPPPADGTAGQAVDPAANGSGPAARTEADGPGDGAAARGPDGAGHGPGADGHGSDGDGAPAAARSHRFPEFTRDTARPEGGGRVASGDAPAPYRQWPLLAVCMGVLAGLLVTLGEFRIGTMIIGLSLLGAGVLRRVMPSVGMLAVRSRFTDLVTYGVLGTVITLLALMVQPNPWLTVPFLDDIVHFSVR